MNTQSGQRSLSNSRLSATRDLPQALSSSKTNINPNSTLTNNPRTVQGSSINSLNASLRSIGSIGNTITNENSPALQAIDSLKKKTDEMINDLKRISRPSATQNESLSNDTGNILRDINNCIGEMRRTSNQDNIRTKKIAHLDHTISHVHTDSAGSISKSEIQKLLNKSVTSPINITTYMAADKKLSTYTLDDFLPSRTSSKLYDELPVRDINTKLISSPILRSSPKNINSSLHVPYNASHELPKINHLLLDSIINKARNDRRKSSIREIVHDSMRDELHNHETIETIRLPSLITEVVEKVLDKLHPILSEAYNQKRANIGLEKLEPFHYIPLVKPTNDAAIQVSKYEIVTTMYELDPTVKSEYKKDLEVQVIVQANPADTSTSREYASSNANDLPTHPTEPRVRFATSKSPKKSAEKILPRKTDKLEKIVEKHVPAPLKLLEAGQYPLCQPEKPIKQELKERERAALRLDEEEFIPRKRENRHKSPNQRSRSRSPLSAVPHTTTNATSSSHYQPLGAGNRQVSRSPSPILADLNRSASPKNRNVQAKYVQDQPRRTQDNSRSPAIARTRFSNLMKDAGTPIDRNRSRSPTGFPNDLSGIKDKTGPALNIDELRGFSPNARASPRVKVNQPPTLRSMETEQVVTTSPRSKNGALKKRISALEEIEMKVQARKRESQALIAPNVTPRDDLTSVASSSRRQEAENADRKNSSTSRRDRVSREDIERMEPAPKSGSSSNASRYDTTRSYKSNPADQIRVEDREKSSRSRSISPLERGSKQSEIIHEVSEEDSSLHSLLHDDRDFSFKHTAREAKAPYETGYFPEVDQIDSKIRRRDLDKLISNVITNLSVSEERALSNRNNSK